MASLKAQKPAGTQSPSTKKEPVKAGTSFPTTAPTPQAVASTPFPTTTLTAPKKAQPKPQEPKKKATPGGKAGAKN